MGKLADMDLDKIDGLSLGGSLLEDKVKDNLSSKAEMSFKEAAKFTQN